MSTHTITKVVKLDKYTSKMWVENEDDPYIVSHSSRDTYKPGDTVKFDDNQDDYSDLTNDYRPDLRTKKYRSPFY